jgi:hypothetical protein
MFCKKCGHPHEIESGSLEEETAESPEFEASEGGESEDDKSKLDILRELIEQTGEAHGKKLASGGAVVRPLPVSKKPSSSAPAPSKPKEIAWGDDEEEDVSDIVSRFRRKV